MTEQDITENGAEDQEEKEGKGGKGKAESGTMSRSEVAVEAGFFEYMSKIGASAAQISEILRNWRQLRGSGLTRAIMDFARAMTRASAHAEVEIAKGKDFGLLHNFIQHFKALRRAPEHKQTLQNKQQNSPGPQ